MWPRRSIGHWGSNHARFDMTLSAAISWSFIGAGALILIGLVQCFLSTMRLHESDVVNWGELSKAEEAEADALGPRFSRLMWAGGATALGGLVWAERDRIAGWVWG